MTKKDLIPFLPLLPVAAGFLAGALSGQPIIGIIVFAATFPGVISQIYPIYRDYMMNNPQNLWFKRKLYGWGWTPVKWQGWLTVFAYAAAVAFIVTKIDRNSHSVSDALIRSIIPLGVLTVVFIIILFKKGETPRWQWGKDSE